MRGDPADTAHAERYRGELDTTSTGTETRQPSQVYWQPSVLALASCAVTLRCLTGTVTRYIRQSAVACCGLMRGDPAEAAEAKAKQASKKKRLARDSDALEFAARLYHVRANAR